MKWLFLGESTQNEHFLVLKGKVEEMNTIGKKSRIGITVCLLSVLLISTSMAPRISFASLATSPSPMFHHDLTHSGVYPFVGTSNPVVRFRFLTGSDVDSSPAVGSDGTI